LESNTVSLDSSDEKDEPEWDYGKIPWEEDEEECNDPTPSMRAYALKYWHYPRVSDAECSTHSDSDSEKDDVKRYPQVHAIKRVNVSSLRRLCQNKKTGRLFLAGLMVVILRFAINPLTTTTHENVIFKSIGEMAGATSYLHVQVTISLSSITQQFELYKAKLQSRFTDPHKGVAKMNQQFAKNLNLSVNGYLENRQAEDDLKIKFPTVKVLPAPHMNTAVIWPRIAQLHYEDLFEIGLHLESSSTGTYGQPRSGGGRFQLLHQYSTQYEKR
jgi:hypothetical protein